MKKLIVVIVSIVALILLFYSLRPNLDSGLNKKSDKGILSNIIDKEGIKIKMNTEKSDYDSGTSEIGLEIINSSSSQVGFGEYYTIEKYDNNTWYEVPFKDNIGFDDILHVLEPNKSFRDVISTLVHKYPLTKGKYRIIKEFYINDDKIVLAAEFNIN